MVAYVVAEPPKASAVTGSWWAVPSAERQASAICAKLTSGYDDAPLPVPNGREEWLMQETLRLPQGRELVVFAPWLTAIGSARLAVTLAYAHRKDVPMVLVTDGTNTLRHLRGLQQRSPGLHGIYTSLVELIEFQAWDGAQLRRLRSSRAGQRDLKCLVVEEAEEVAPALAAAGAKVPGLIVAVSLEELEDDGLSKKYPSSGVVRFVLSARSSGRPPRNILHPRPPAEEPYGGARPIAGPADLYVRLRDSCRRGPLIEQKVVDVEVGSLRRLAEATKALVNRDDNSSGLYKAAIRQAFSLLNELGSTLEPVGDTHAEVIPFLIDMQLQVPLHLRDAWLAWFEAYTEAVNDLRGRVPAKGNLFIEWVKVQEGAVVLVNGKTGAEALRRTFSRLGIRVPVETVNLAANRRVLSECRWQDLPPSVRRSGLDHAILLVPLRRRDMERVCQGTFDKVTVWTYPHEASRLAGSLANLHSRNLTRTTPAVVRVPEGFEDVSEERLEELTEWVPQSGHYPADEVAEEEQAVREALGVARLRLKLESGREILAPPFRSYFAVRNFEVNRFRADALRKGDLLVELPSLAGSSGDLVHAIFRTSTTLEQLQTQAMLWRTTLIQHFKHWKRLEEDNGRETTMARFFREKLPGLQVSVEAVRNWLDESVDMPLEENLEALLAALGFQRPQIAKMTAAQREYRSLRMKAHHHLKIELLRLFRRRLGKAAASADEEDERDDTFVEVRSMLATHIHGVKFSKVSGPPEPVT